MIHVLATISGKKTRTLCESLAKTVFAGFNSVELYINYDKDIEFDVMDELSHFKWVHGGMFFKPFLSSIGVGLVLLENNRLFVNFSLGPSEYVVCA